MKFPSFSFDNGYVRKPVAVASIVTLFATGLVAGGVVSAASAASAAGSDGVPARTYYYTGDEETFEVPEGVVKMAFEGVGGMGGRGLQANDGTRASGGFGAYATAAVPVSAGDQLKIKVAGHGGDGSSGSNPQAYGGYNGGGAGGYTGTFKGGGGGGATTVHNAESPVLVVSGGGGGGGGTDNSGILGGDGAAGAQNGATGANGGGESGGAGGEGAGQPNHIGGEGGNGTSGDLLTGGSGGGGGGGYYGGSGGGGGFAEKGWSGGGGGGSGSSFAAVDATNVNYGTASSGGAAAILRWRTIETKSLPDVVNGVSYAGQLKQRGDDDYSSVTGWSVSQGTLPQGLVLDSGTGALSGTPVGNVPGSEQVTFQVSDSSGAVSQQQITFEVFDHTPVIADQEVTDLTKTSAKGHASVTTTDFSLDNIQCRLSTHSDMSSSTDVVAVPSDVGQGQSDIPVTCDFESLNPDTTYYYKFVGTYGSQTEDSGLVMSFKTFAPLPPAQVSAAPASEITESTAKGNGAVVGGESELRELACLISESADMSGATSVDAEPTSVNPGVSSEVTCSFNGLAPDTYYYYQVVGVDDEGSHDSRDAVEFRTLAEQVATVEVTSATDVEQNTATGNGIVTTAGRSVTDVKCLYAQGDGEGEVEEIDAVPGTVDDPASSVPVECHFNGLAADTEYLYLVVVQDGQHLVYSDLEAFTTKAAPKPPTPPVPPKPVVKQKQQLRSGAAPKKIKYKGVTTLNKRKATTRQGVAVTVKVSKIRTKCGKIVKGKQRQLSLRTLGKCKFTLRVTYTAKGTSKYKPLKVAKTYKVRR